LESIEDKISALGVEAYEIYRILSRQLWVESKDLSVELSHQATTSGIALQLFRGGKVGFASSSREEDRSLARMVELAYHSLDAVEEGTPVPLFHGKPDSLPLSDRGLLGRPFREKAALAIAMEREALGFDPRVRRVRGARYQEEEETVTLRNSSGFEGGFSKTICELSLMVMAEESGRQEMAWESSFSPFFEELEAEEVAHRAAERAVSLLGAGPVPSRKVAALLEPQVATSFLSVLSSSFLGDQVMKGKSSLADKIGQEIYSEKVSLIDDGRYPKGYATAPFDGEGALTQKTTLVEKGRLIGFLHNGLSAARLKRQSTGNAVRAAYKERPVVGVTNFYLQPSAASPDKMVREMGQGFFVTDVIGVHTANPVTGDFSLGAAGFWIEKGERRPVRGVTVSGNLHDLFRKVVAVGSDLRFYHGFGSPSLLVSEMDIGGL